MLTLEQKKLRKLGVGGSDVAVLFGLSTYKTEYQLYLEKTSEIDEIEEEKENNLQYWGNKLEPIIRDEFAKKHNVEVELLDTVVHSKYDFMRANVDGFIREKNAVLEVKCSNSFMSKEWGETGSDCIPMQYLLQVAHYCACLDADEAYIAVLIGGNDYREYKYTRNLDLENAIIEKCKEFWNRVQTKNAPDASTQLDLRLMYPLHESEKKVAVTDDTQKTIEKLLSIEKDIKALNDIKEKKKFELMQYMQDAEALVDQNGQKIATWKANKNGSRVFLLKKGDL